MFLLRLFSGDFDHIMLFQIGTNTYVHVQHFEICGFLTNNIVGRKETISNKENVLTCYQVCVCVWVGGGGWVWVCFYGIDEYFLFIISGDSTTYVFVL